MGVQRASSGLLFHCYSWTHVEWCFQSSVYPQDIGGPVCRGYQLLPYTAVVYTQGRVFYDALASEEH